ncbi:MAG: PAS domain S-box protein [Chitinophagaceae bacterium]|nr:PAS domain S-box protein [Chitinophagaceae bacterium]
MNSIPPPGETNTATLLTDLQNRIVRLTQIIEGTDIAPWEFNLQTGETIFSKRWAQMIGYELHELGTVNAETWKLYVHPDDLVISEKLWEEHLAGRLKFYECEMRMKHKLGHWVWMKDKGKIAGITADGKAEWITGALHDIHERKQNELLLIQFKTLFERAIEAAEMGTWEYNIADNKLSWNAVVKEIHEVPEDYQPDLDKCFSFFVEGETRNKISKYFNDAITRGINYDLEVEIITYNNNRIWVRTIGIAEFEKDVCIRVHGLFQDINEKTLILKKLAIQEERFRQTFEYAPHGMALVGLDGKWLRVNKNLCDMLGYSEQELLTLTFQDLTHPDDLDKDVSLLHELLGGSVEHYQLEKRYIHENGDFVWTLLSVSIVKNDLGEPMHFVSQINDITERREMLESIQEKNQRLLNFAHIVSHNLRSHSANFSQMLDLLKVQYPEATENEYYPMLLRASANLKETISNLNEITLIQTKTIDSLERLNLFTYANVAIASINALAIETHAAIINNIDPDLFVNGVPAYLESIFLNFLTNSIKYRRPDVKPEIVLASESLSGFVVLSIKDNGLGINLATNKDKLFGMYKTFHAHPEARGIGLFITKNQVDALGGKIEVTSTVNEGTEFKIYFPMKQSEKTEQSRHGFFLQPEVRF